MGVRYPAKRSLLPAEWNTSALFQTEEGTILIRSQSKTPRRGREERPLRLAAPGIHINPRAEVTFGHGTASRSRLVPGRLNRYA